MQLLKTLDVLLRVVVFPAATENTGCIHKHALCTRRHFPRLLQSISQDAILRCNFPIRHNSVHASHNSESFSFVYCCEVFHRRSGFSCGVGFTRARGCVRACSIRWSAMAFCFCASYFVTFTYWGLQNDGSACVSVCVCVCVCECVCLCVCVCVVGEEKTWTCKN